MTPRRKVVTSPPLHSTGLFQYLFPVVSPSCDSHSSAGKSIYLFFFHRKCYLHFLDHHTYFRKSLKTQRGSPKMLLWR